MGRGNGSFRLFQAAGVEVFLHWSWIVVAIFQISYRPNPYGAPLWKVAEYLSLFGIVLLHEFGHSLACRQVGGIAERITLWPLGGIAYVNPPPRAGALLWSIAAGPLVNVALVPVLAGLNVLAVRAGAPHDIRMFLYTIQFINGVLLVFNMLPIYPLDGGQIVRALLWFVIGRHRSLYVASVIGIIGGLGVIGLAIYWQNLWFGVLAVFMISQCIQGFRQGHILSRLAAVPRHDEIKCPGCGAAPFKGPAWSCGNCGERFDTFETGGRCPSCGASFETTNCPECRRSYPLEQWLRR